MGRLGRTVSITVRVEPALLQKIDELVSSGICRSRSEFVREGIRRLLLEYSKRRWW